MKVIELELAGERDRPLRVLALGAHCDDIEIGCGGTLLTLVGSPRPVEVEWIVFSSGAGRREEAERSAGRFLAGTRAANVRVEDFRNGYFPWIGAEIKDYMEALKRRVVPDLIFTHWREDWHQDHRLLNELTWNTFRDHAILEYEVPKYDPDTAAPNLFVELEQGIVERKIETILDCFVSQRDKHWFAASTFRGLMRLRGVQAASASGHAEAFYARKLALRAGRANG